MERSISNTPGNNLCIISGTPCPKVVNIYFLTVNITSSLITISYSKMVLFLEKKKNVFVKGFEVSDEKYRQSSWIYFKSLLVH